MQIIPAIDIIDGRCVRLTQGDYNQKKEYNASPLDVAKSYQDVGIKRLHLVDLDGAKQKKIVNIGVLERIASCTDLLIDFGGGIQSKEDIAVAFEAGANQITAGSIAVKNPTLVLEWLEHYGAEKIILGADARNERIAISGWQEETDVSVYDFLADWIAKGIRYTISTDVAKDGLLQGTSVELYSEMKKRFPDLQLIASGGVSNMADIEALIPLNVFGVIVGKAIYEGRITLQALAKFNA
jgi:phosphoribosylformimino-5-aminoimidazole carboxamide ribotide isomerase